MDKLIVSAAVEGQTREFIFDTGSPTILSRRLADSLGLERVGSSAGRDANGRVVTMDTAVVQTLSLGDLTFHQVPVLVFDFDQLYLGPCIFDGGVLGSELLPGSVWRFDTGRGQLQIADDGSRLAASSPVLSAPMYDLGYPHYPVVDYAMGNLTDKALFDTGNAGELVLFSRVVQDVGVQERMVSGSVRRGRGSDGVSAGGAGPVRDLLHFTVSELSVGAQPLGPLRASTRDSAPTLLGAGLLDRYVVTLDGVTQRFVLEERVPPRPARREAGYAVTLEEGGTRVSQIFESSPAAGAGLQLGDRVIAIDSRPLDGPQAPERCALATLLLEEMDWAAAVELTVERGNAPIVLQIPAVVP
jgi:predicted aspartyl protease